MADFNRLFGILAALACCAQQSQAQTKYPVPFVNQPLVPATVAPDGHAFVLTVNGSGFTAQSVVMWNGNSRKTVFVNDTQLTARIGAADIATAATAMVTVANPGAAHPVSNAEPFEITTPEQSIPLQVGPTILPLGAPMAADLNGDGIPDLVSFAGTSVTVALGTGGGQFGPAQSYSTALPYVGALAIGDKGDGKPNLVVSGIDGFQILVNNGDGTFAQGFKEINYDFYFTSLAVGDFNGDGLLDVAAGQASDPAIVYVMLGKPGGRFDAPVPYTVGLGPVAVITADFNGDSKLDLATVNGDDSISILLGNGDGTFQPQMVFATGANGDFPSGLLAADFNGDGIPDLARAAALDTAGVGILLGNGDGTFQPVQIFEGSSYGIVAGDFNGDGKLDLAVGGNASGPGILLGNGNGTFQPLLNFYLGTPAFSPAVADFNQDGRPDLAVITDALGIVVLLQ